MKTVTSWDDRPEKSAGDTLDYELDWGPWLEGATIADSGAVAYGCTLEGEEVAADIQKVWLSGGIRGRRAYVDCWVTKATTPTTRVYRRLYVVIV